MRHDDGDKLRSKVFFNRYTSVLKKGSVEKLTIDDLPPLPSQFDTVHNVREFCSRAGAPPPPLKSADPSKPAPSKYVGNGKAWPLVRTILACHWQSVLKVTVLKILSCALSFVGPILLGSLVNILDEGVDGSNLMHAIGIVTVLCITSMISIVVNTNTNARSLEIKLKLLSTMTYIVFSKSLSLTMFETQKLQFSEAQLNNFIQVDVDQIAN